MNIENNLIVLVTAIRHFLEGLNKVHLKPFLANWSSTTCVTGSFAPNSLPVLSYNRKIPLAAG